MWNYWYEHTITSKRDQSKGRKLYVYKNGGNVHKLIDFTLKISLPKSDIRFTLNIASNGKGIIYTIRIIAILN